jgi:PAS domain S-box-containing protein
VERSGNHNQLRQETSARHWGPSASSLRLLLLEPRDSPFASRIEKAAAEAGLTVSYLDAIDAAPPNATLVGVGPSVPDPLQIARKLRAAGAQPLLVFFTASASARVAVQAELVRDPFLYPRFELLELPDNARQLATRMGKVVARVTRQLHALPVPGRRRRRLRASAAHTRFAAKGEIYLAHILAQSPDAIMATDEAGGIEAWNDAAERLFGFKAEAVVGRTAAFLDCAEDHQPLTTIVQEVMASGQPHQAPVTCVTAKGAAVQVAVSVAPIRDSQGTLVGASVIARDDSEFRRIQEALREARRQKNEFLAIMSHELRTPLTSILGYTDMLMRGLSGPLAPLANKYIGNVRSAGERLLELVNGLLDYTRLEAGAERLELRPVDLSQVVGQAVQYVQGTATSKQIELRVVVEGGFVPQVEADEERLTHVVRSFLNNAVKFTPNGGWVRATIARDPEEAAAVRVSVADSGIGMQSGQIGRVWEHFYQGDASLTRPFGGMGLGLSIARHLITLHGGSVGAESSGPDRGSTFWFTLPLRRRA